MKRDDLIAKLLNSVTGFLKMDVNSVARNEKLGPFHFEALQGDLTEIKKYCSLIVGVNTGDFSESQMAFISEKFEGLNKEMKKLLEFSPEQHDPLSMRNTLQKNFQSSWNRMRDELTSPLLFATTFRLTEHVRQIETVAKRSVEEAISKHDAWANQFQDRC